MFFGGLRRRRGTTRGKIRLILSLAIPAMIENLLQTVVGFVDTLFVSKLGLVEVTAVGVSNAVLAVYIAIFMALGVGTSALIAKNVGAGDMERAKSVAKHSTLIASIAGLLLGIVALFFAEPLLRVMGAEPRVLAIAVDYFRIVAVPSIFISLMFVLGSILRAAGDTKTPMIVSWWINILHIGLDYVLIFGIWKFSGLGVAGAAWATVIVRLAGTLALYNRIRISKLAFSWKNPSREFTSPLLKLSTPAAAERLIMRLGQETHIGSLSVRHNNRRGCGWIHVVDREYAIFPCTVVRNVVYIGKNRN